MNDPTVNQAEALIWQSNPSHLIYFKEYCIAALMTPLLGIGLFYALFIYLKVINTSYELTSQRFRISSGVLSKVIHELELYRVIDNPLVEQPFLLNLFGLGNITIYSSDHTMKTVYLLGIKTPEHVKETIRNTVEKVRTHKNVRMVDVERN